MFFFNAHKQSINTIVFVKIYYAHLRYIDIQILKETVRKMDIILQLSSEGSKMNSEISYNSFCQLSV